MKISARSTKAEILAHCQELQQQIDQGPDWPQIWAKLQAAAAIVSRETVLLIRDTFNAGAATRRAVQYVVDELTPSR